MHESSPIPLPCGCHAIENAIRSFCHDNACYDTAYVIVRDNALIIVKPVDLKGEI